MQAASQSMLLLGKTVEVETGAATEVGTVIAIAFENGAPVLTIEKPNGSFLSDLRLSQINAVN